MFIFFIFFSACKQSEKRLETTSYKIYNAETTSTEDEQILIGPTTRIGLESKPYVDWFNESYSSYQLDSIRLDTLKTLLSDISIKVFLATWCEDSQREVPSFFKMLDYLQFDNSRLELISVDREKKSNGGETEGMNIEFIPTFIFFHLNQEVGRITESATNSLEIDLLSIVQKV